MSQLAVALADATGQANRQFSGSADGSKEKGTRELSHAPQKVISLHPDCHPAYWMKGGRGGGRNGLRTGGRYGGRTLEPNARSEPAAGIANGPIVGVTDKATTELALMADVDAVVVTGAAGARIAANAAADAQ